VGSVNEPSNDGSTNNDMADSHITCRICKFAQKSRPDRQKLMPGRIWCICYRKELNNNRTCPKAEAAEATAGMMRKKTAKPIHKNAFVGGRG